MPEAYRSTGRATVPAMRFFDGHLDLAMLVECGRDMHATLDRCRGSLLPAAVTLPSLREGGVTHCLGTIFTQACDADSPDLQHAYAYPWDDKNAAYRAGMRQLKLYHAWQDGGLIDLMPPRGMAHAARARQPLSDAPPEHAPIVVGILMESADPITTPDELADWAAGGLIAVGMAWHRSSRYAGGNGSANAPITDLGRALVQAIDDANLVHDASHLSQRSLDELLDLTDRPIIASHSNCRTLLGVENHRHLSDDAIRAIAARGGIIGINLVRNFLSPALARAPRPAEGDATIEQVCDHIDHVCALAGDRRHVALGSDMDGGITADDLPRGIDQPSDLQKIASALGARGWSDADVAGFAHGNWSRFWSGS